ncbi:MAG: zinc-dependent metalloprotease [Planctomycetota bacterium]|nr:zinc-dependent metalloprotease [Planctomycetota bacterium]
MRTTIAPFALSLTLLVALAPAQEGRRGPDRGGDKSSAKEGAKDEIKPYDEVIPEEAETSRGLFTVHRVDEKLLYEIPADGLNRDMLWVSHIAATQAGHGYGGTPSGRRVVRWELRGKNVLLRDVKYTIRADGDDAVTNAVDATSVAPILASFPIKAWGKDKTPVIDVTEFVAGDPDAFSPKSRLNASSFDSKRSFLDEVKAFPTNIEVKVLKTFKLSDNPPSSGGGRPTSGRRGGRGGGSLTVLQHHSMTALPENPMTPRLSDARVGYFDVSFEDYASEEHAVEEVSYITRWRLEKKDPEAEVSEPVKPIVFHVGRGVPDKWRPFVHQGIEYWQPAFEAAGFKNAIIAKDAPSKREDPDWDAEDARYSSIRWLPSTVENAMGPHVNDPRTGEILESDILVYHTVLKLCRDWYFVQASPTDPRAQQLPMPDDLLGELLAYVTPHYVAHTLGFPHNMKASSSFTVAQLRDADFTAEHGVEASIMDYGRFNYVAQPGDGARLIPKVGPYDYFAVEWGYRQYTDAKAEEAGLDALLAKQVADVTLRFGGSNSSEDPSQQTEDLGSDPVAATAMGLANLDRVAGYLISATCEEGENYDLLRNMYDQIHSQRGRELRHVANMVGGFYKTNLFFGDADRMWEPLPADRQRGAMAFLTANAFTTPAALVDPALLARLETNGAADKLVGGQSSLLRTLMSESRIKRMAEEAAHDPEGAYAPVEMVRDLSEAAWQDLLGESTALDLYARNLQRAHVEILAAAAKEEAPKSDLAGLARGELQWVLQLATESLGGAGDESTRRHMVDVIARVKADLDPTGSSKDARAVRTSTSGQ